jgi:hypothetical protein
MTLLFFGSRLSLNMGQRRKNLASDTRTELTNASRVPVTSHADGVRIGFVQNVAAM